MSRPERVFDKYAFLRLYDKNHCLYLKTCKEYGIDQKTVDTKRKEDPKFDQAIKDLQYLLAENVEGSLVQEALTGTNIVAKIFYLKNNWREKYGEHVEHEVVPSNLWFQKKEPLQIETKEE